LVDSGASRSVRSGPAISRVSEKWGNVVIVTGISAEEFREVVSRVSRELYNGNLVAEVGRVYSLNRFNTHEDGANLAIRDLVAGVRA